MADAAKTVSIIFEGETTDAVAKVGALAEAIKKIDDAAGAPKVGDLGSSITDLGSKATDSAGNLGALREGIIGFADGLGVPKDRIDGLTSAITAFGVGPAAAVVIAGASLLTFAGLAISAAADARDLKISVENLTGSAEDSSRAWEFVKTAVVALESNLTTTKDLYKDFLIQLEGTAVTTATAEAAFIGIFRALESVGKEATAPAVLKAFADAAKDGDISVRDLDTKIRDIPGGIRIFADELGVSRDRLYEMARNGELGREEIGRLVDALARTDAKSLSPITNAFEDLKNAIKLTGEAWTGTEKSIITSTIETTLRELTLGFVAIDSTAKLFKDTAGAIFTLLTTGDWAGFKTTVKSAWDELTTTVGSYAAKLRGDPDSVATNAWAAERAAVRAAENAGEAFTKAKDAVAGAGDTMKSSFDALDRTLKDLGIDPKSLVDPIEATKGALAELLANPILSDKALELALPAALDKIPPSATLAAEAVALVNKAQDDNKISAEAGAKARGDIDLWATGISKTLNELTNPALKNTKSEMDNNAKAANDATKAANDFIAKMEKIASDERIKTIEAAVKLDIAEVEANAKIAVAAFETMSDSIKDTGEVLTELFGILVKGTTDWTSFRAIMTEIERESKRRDDLIKAQVEYFAAQTALLKAKADALAAGGALLKIEGDGLAPHLEAFMWEILEAVRVRVSAEGLEMLVGI